MTSVELLARAKAVADAKEWEKAADILAAAMPTNEVLDRRGWYRSRAKRYDEAIADFELLRARRPHDYLPPYMIGYQYYQQQRWSEALLYFDEALAHHQGHIRSLWRRAHALHCIGREVEAVVAAGRVLRAWHALPGDKQDADRHFYAKACHLIARYQVAHDPNGAVELLREAVEHEPTDPYHHYQLAKALRRSGKPTDALQSADNARRLKQDDANIELEYVNVLVSGDHLSDAAACLRRVQQRCRGWTAYRAGILALKLGDPTLATDLLSRASKDRDTRGEPRVQQALSDALLALENTAATLDPNPNEASFEATTRPRRPRVRNRPSVRLAETASQTAGEDVAGTVDVVRDDRNFGFLIDDDGVRRHFRLSRAHPLRKGQRVVFTAMSAPKGPAAENVRPA
jgi:tetratricopeptide (TPR) repeat protein/cold shock CspA family protein